METTDEVKVELVFLLQMLPNALSAGDNRVGLSSTFQFSQQGDGGEAKPNDQVVNLLDVVRRGHHGSRLVRSRILSCSSEKLSRDFLICDKRGDRGLGASILQC